VFTEQILHVPFGETITVGVIIRCRGSKFVIHSSPLALHAMA
jgi:hypothetical protein